MDGQAEGALRGRSPGHPTGTTTTQEGASVLTPTVTPITTPPRLCQWHSAGRAGGPCPACMRFRALRLKAQETAAERSAVVQAEPPLIRLPMAGLGA